MDPKGAFVIGVAVYLRIVNWIAQPGYEESLKLIDNVCTFVGIAVLLAFHLYFGKKAKNLSDADQPREDELRRILDEETKDHKDKGLFDSVAGAMGDAVEGA